MAQVLRQLPAFKNERVLVGTEMPDDAAVFLVNPELAIVQTVDFLTPVVDDPYQFGQVAAANALSDAWAMGVDPLFALNIVAFPVKKLPLTVLVEILRGGADKCREAGVSILGGHSIDDPEPKYGLAVTATTHPDRIITKSGARPGDLLVLTKPLGIGIVTTALKQGRAPAGAVERATEVMVALNGPAARVMRAVGGVDACTDVTGYGLLGHLREMAAQSGVGARVRLGDVPVIDATWGLVRQKIAPEGAWKNLEFMDQHVQWAPDISREARLVLCDAQTSGGLLIAVRPDKAGALLDELHAAGVPDAAIVGEVTEGPAGRLEVLP